MPLRIAPMACSRIPKCRIRPAGAGLQCSVFHLAGTNEPPPSMVVLFDSARSAEPPQSSGSLAAKALITLPDAARVAISVPASNLGSAASRSLGRSPASSLAKRSADSGLADFQALNFASHSALWAAPLVTRDRVWARTSEETWKFCSGSNPRFTFRPDSSSAPSFDP